MKSEKPSRAAKLPKKIIPHSYNHVPYFYGSFSQNFLTLILFHPSFRSYQIFLLKRDALDVMDFRMHFRLHQSSRRNRMLRG